MPRLHLFEFMDQPWLPSIIRDGQTDFLEFYLNHFNIYQPIYPNIVALMQKTSTFTILDLCSGGGGPIISLKRYFKKNNLDCDIYITDKFPNKKACERFRSYNNIYCLEESIDATAVPAHFKKTRTLFSSFHHFRPEMGQEIIQNAVKNGQPIAIFEFTSRHIISIIRILFALLLVPLTTLFMRPFNFKKILFTFFIPIIPIICTWDGIISCLRTYSMTELQEMIKTIDEGYHWEIGRKFSFAGFCFITYLIGYKK